MLRATTVALAVVAATNFVWPQNSEVAANVINELRAARTAYTLQITKQQAEDILSTTAKLRKSQADFAKWAAQQWATAGKTVKAAIRAWSAGEQVTQEQFNAVVSLAREVDQKIESQHEAAVAAAHEVLKALGQNAGAVETEQQAEQRRVVERQLSGARSPAEAVVSAAEALRLLMPDDYALVRVAEAQRLAGAIAGGNPPPQLVATVLGVLDSLVDMPPQRFAGDRPQLLAYVARQLNLPPSAAAFPEITWDQFLAWLSAPETATVLATIAGQTPPGRTQIPKEFSLALAQARVMVFAADLRLSPAQTAVLVQWLRGVAEAVEEAEKDRESLAEKALELLPDVREALKSGKPLEGKLADKLQQVLAAAEEIDAKLKLAMVGYIRRLRRILTPPQRQLIDWVPPGDVLRLLPPGARVDQLRRRAALIAQAIDFLNRIKYQIAKRYMNLKVSLSQRFVADFIPPDSPDYDQAVSFVIDLVGEARMVPREEWEGGADVEYATRLMRGLGVIRDLLPPPPTGQELYTWSTLYEMFTQPAVAKTFAQQGAEQ